MPVVSNPDTAVHEVIATPASPPTGVGAVAPHPTAVAAEPGRPPGVPAKPVSAAEPVPPGGPDDDWVSLESWSAAHHWSPLEDLDPGPAGGRQFRVPAGVLSLTLGSQLARLDGVVCWLGYAPRLADGILRVHTLDARKNLLPLSDPEAGTDSGDRVVVIDPGHGGENTGTRSVADHHFEKEFTLDWALRLRPLLEKSGWTVILTRAGDADVSLSERVAVADRAHAALFVSLHFNSGARPDQSGIETYCLTPAGLPSTLTREYEDDVTRVYPNNRFDSGNLQLALRLHRSLLEGTGAIDRGVRRARFMAVLRDQQRPAVLIEGGYLSNAQEARSIAGPEFRQRLAESVARALEHRDGPAAAVRPGAEGELLRPPEHPDHPPGT